MNVSDIVIVKVEGKILRIPFLKAWTKFIVRKLFDVP